MIIVRRLRTWPKVVIGIFILSALACGIYCSQWFQSKYAYPFLHRELVYKYALENDLSPFLIAGIIKVESGFKKDALSPKGAMGLMQIMPKTGRWAAEKINYHGYLEDNVLNDPETNIKLGAWYLSFLQHEFYDNEILYLAAYNGGLGNVKQWMAKYGWDRDFSDIEQIPFPETRNYVKKVLYYKKQYQEKYGR